MLLIFAGLVLGLWILYSGWKFYQNIDWEEPPEPSPDLQAMHKKEAELSHIRDVLAQAFTELRGHGFCVLGDPF